MNGDILLLKLNGKQLTFDLVFQCSIKDLAKKIYGLSKLSDGRICIC